jgi:hypothetical protein
LKIKQRLKISGGNWEILETGGSLGAKGFRESLVRHPLTFVCVFGIGIRSSICLSDFCWVLICFVGEKCEFGSWIPVQLAKPFPDFLESRRLVGISG